MPEAIFEKMRDFDLPINRSSFIRTVQELRKLPMDEFEPMLKEIYPDVAYGSPLKTKYVFIYVVQEALRKASAGITVNMDRHLRECEEKADVLLANHPFIDFMQLPDYEGEGTVYPSARVSKSPKSSVLKQVKSFCDENSDVDRKQLVKMVISEFEIDKGKANTYVHLWLKGRGVLETKSKKDKGKEDKKVSDLKKVKNYVSNHKDEERRKLVADVINLYGLDKGKANTYVHLALKEA